MLSPAVVEWMPARGRTAAGALLGFSFTLGQLILAGVAYLIRPWRRLQFAVSVPFLIFSLYSWYVRSRAGGGGSLWEVQGSAVPGTCSSWGCNMKGGGARGATAPSVCVATGKLWKIPFTQHGAPGQSERFCLYRPLCVSQPPSAFSRRDARHSQGRVRDLFQAMHPGQIQILNWTCPSPKSTLSTSVVLCLMCCK